jgi:hypothetical protein
VELSLSSQDEICADGRGRSRLAGPRNFGVRPYGKDDSHANTVSPICR